jgi:outer membrane immunogenic protein
MRTRILIAACMTALMSGASVAADMEIEPRAYRPPILQQVYDWTGLYFGVNLGYGWAHGSSSTGFNNGVLNGISVTNTADLSGPIVGGQAGFNFQAGWLVFGMELDFQWVGQKQTVTTVCGAACFINDDIKIRGLVTGRARVGAAYDRVFGYVTIGAAFLSVSDELTVTNNGVSDTFLPISNSGLGWTVGAGVEVAFWGNWSAKLEYLYVDVDGLTSNGGVASVFVLAAPNPFAGGTVTESWRFRENILRVGANYRFGP